jgi:hypothetical protein
MIIKKIHYCWFGRGTLPSLAQKCIDSWKKYCPDYEIIEWNEDNFDININRYVKEAYEANKYAFVTDYVRLHVLYNVGGIYMDTDVEVKQSLDQFLVHLAFAGVESDEYIGTGIIGATKNHPWIGKLLNEYNNRHFILSNGEMDITNNVGRVTRLTIECYGWLPQNKHQELKDGVNIYPFNTFCSKNWQTRRVMITEQTFTVHHFSGSWLPEVDRIKMEYKNKLKRIITNVLGEKGFKILLVIKNSIRKLIVSYKE